MSPLTIGITAHFYKKMMTFAFPEKDADTIDEEFEIDKKQKKKSRKSKVSQRSRKYYWSNSKNFTKTFV